MASVQRHGKRWRVQLYVNGRRESAVRDTKAEAAAWALEREAQLKGTKLPFKTVGDAMERFREEVAPGRRGARWEVTRLTRMEKDPLAKVALSALSAADLGGYRDRRLEHVSGASVRREFSLLGAVLGEARREWGWLRGNPLQDVRKPQAPPSRKRRISADEVRRMTLAFGLSGFEYQSGTHILSAMQRTGLAFLFALETAMRAGEILGLTPEHVHLSKRYVHLPNTKNGDARDVPLSSRALEILEAVSDPDSSTVFGLNPGTRDVMFRRARDAAEIPNLHFHDSRAEAIWRLSDKLNVLELARVIGHRDIRSLMIYYDADASELAKRLD